MSNTDPQSDAARLAAHRRLHNFLIEPHPDLSHRIDVRDLDRDRLARTRLVDLGWTPPRHAVDRPQVPIKAWMHPKADLVSTDPHAYTNLSTGAPRELVAKSDVYDHVDWLEHGIEEWRALALEALQTARDLRQQLQSALAERMSEQSESVPTP